MTTSIFIKTCRKDLEWLRYSLLSIAKWSVGFSEFVIVADEDCRDTLEPIAALLPEPYWIYYVLGSDNGYIQQQAIKLAADIYCSSDYILFVDSDCVFFRIFMPSSFMHNGKPVLMKTRYGNLGGAEAWKAITESIVGWEVEFEYMRRLPLMYRKDTLRKFRERFPSLLPKLSVMESRDFSEFNALGAFIEKEDKEGYYIADTEDWVLDAVAKQFWSWGGISPDIRNEMEEMITLC